jgi:hypothetical protein
MGFLLTGSLVRSPKLQKLAPSLTLTCKMSSYRLNGSHPLMMKAMILAAVLTLLMHALIYPMTNVAMLS